MGVKTTLSLQKAKQLFPTFKIDILKATNSGLVDTTYLSSYYVLKYYERDIDIQQDTKRLHIIQKYCGCVTTLLDTHQRWYLYNRLHGKHLKKLSFLHVRNLARFMRCYHQLSLECEKDFFDTSKVRKILQMIKSRYFYYFKNLEDVVCYQENSDGFIHGDLFLDNILFDKSHIGVIDFVDGGCGSRAFDIAVSFIGTKIAKQPAKMNFFLDVYNQTNTKKITQEEVQTLLPIASHYYALLRIEYFGNTKRSKELL